MKKTKKTVKKAKTAVITPEPEKVEEVKIDYVKLFEKWLEKYSRMENGGMKYQFDEEFLEKENIEEIIKNLPPYQEEYFVNPILRVAHIGLINPLHILSALDYDGGNAFWPRIQEYLENDSAKDWNISFLELVSRMDSPMQYLEQLSWGQELETIKNTFLAFANGPVSECGHSNELYAFMFDLFFGTGNYSLNPSFICAVMSAEISSGKNTEECANIMKGILKMAKKGIFLWDFEEFTKK